MPDGCRRQVHPARDLLVGGAIGEVPDRLEFPRPEAIERRPGVQFDNKQAGNGADPDAELVSPERLIRPCFEMTAQCVRQEWAVPVRPLDLDAIGEFLVRAADGPVGAADRAPDRVSTFLAAQKPHRAIVPHRGGKMRNEGFHRLDFHCDERRIRAAAINRQKADHSKTVVEGANPQEMPQPEGSRPGPECRVCPAVLDIDDGGLPKDHARQIRHSNGRQREGWHVFEAGFGFAREVLTDL